MPCLVICGEEDFLVARRAQELCQKLVDPEYSAFNFVRLNNPDLLTVNQAALSLPFGQGQKLVLVEGTELFTKKKSQRRQAEPDESQSKQLLEDFDLALGQIHESTYLVFVAPYNFDKSLRAAKIVEKHAEISEFKKEKYFPGSKCPPLETFCRKEAHHFGATIDDQAINYLLAATEANLRQLAKEIEKAAVFVLPKTHITYDVVSQLSSHHSHIFAFMDAWAQGHKANTLACLNELLSRQSGMPIMAALQTTLSRWLEVKAQAEDIYSAQKLGPGMKRRDLPLNELAKKVAWQTKSAPFLVEMDLKRIKSLSLAWLSEKRNELAYLEFLAKTGQMPAEQALYLLVAS